MNHILTSLSAYGITMLLLWLFTRKDEKVKDHWRRPFGVFLRMAALFILLHFLLTSLPFPLWVSYFVIVFIIAYSFIWQLYDIDFLAVAIISWMVYQWAFWFPSKLEIVLKAELSQNLESNTLALKSGIALTDLKPVGKIIIEGKERTAISTLGFIESGTRVLVEDSDGMELRVRKERNG